MKLIKRSFFVELKTLSPSQIPAVMHRLVLLPTIVHSERTLVLPSVFLLYGIPHLSCFVALSISSPRTTDPSYYPQVTISSLKLTDYEETSGLELAHYPVKPEYFHDVWFNPFNQLEKLQVRTCLTAVEDIRSECKRMEHMWRGCMQYNDSCD